MVSQERVAFEGAVLLSLGRCAKRDGTFGVTIDGVEHRVERRNGKVKVDQQDWVTGAPRKHFPGCVLQEFLMLMNEELIVFSDRMSVEVDGRRRGTVILRCNTPVAYAWTDLDADAVVYFDLIIGIHPDRLTRR